MRNTVPDKRTGRRHLLTLIKIAIAGILIGSLFYSRVITFEALGDIFGNFPVAVSAFAILLFGHALAALRWYVLLRTMGIPIRLRACIEIFAIGTFANTFLPGGTGGDLLRSVYVARDVHSDRAGGVISVFVDRAMGLSGLLAVTALVGLAAAEHPGAAVSTRSTAIILSAVFVGMVIGVIATLYLVTPARLEQLRAYIGTRTVFRRAFLRMFEIGASLGRKPVAVLVSFALSVAIALTIAISIILLSQGYERGGLTPLDFSYAALLALIANVVPITPGGIGVGETAFVFLCAAWETTRSALPYGTIFFGYRLLTMLISLLCAVGFVTYRRQQQGVEMQTSSLPDNG